MNISAEIYKRITADVGDYDAFSEIEAARDKEQDNLLEQMSNKFGDTLSKDQLEAYRAVLGIYDSVSWSRYEQGIVLGFKLSKALHELIDNPIAAYKSVTESYNPVDVANSYEIKDLHKYFKEQELSA